MASNKDIRALIAARREGRGVARPGVPQLDPADLISQPPEPPVIDEAPKEEPREQSKLPVVKTSVPEPANKPTPRKDPTPQPSIIQDPRLQPVDKTVPLVAFSSYIYPDRKRQVKQESISTGQDMHEIFDTALQEYFERRYGKQYKRK